MTEQDSGGFSDLERAAIKQRAAELKQEASNKGRAAKLAQAELDCLEKIAAMDPADRVMAERIHAIITETTDLTPRLYYGQPGYADGSGRVVVFFRSGIGDKERYSTLGFSAEANLDHVSGLWPSAYALAELTKEAEAQVTKLVKKAVG